MPRVLGRVRSSTWRDLVALRTSALVGPHGCTLTITGAFILTAAGRGLPGPLAAYLFVVGASLGISVLALWSRPRRLPAGRATPHPASINPVPLVAGPLAAGPATLIPTETVAFTVAGAVASAGYVLLWSALSMWHHSANDSSAAGWTVGRPDDGQNARSQMTGRRE